MAAGRTASKESVPDEPSADEPSADKPSADEPSVDETGAFDACGLEWRVERAWVDLVQGEIAPRLNELDGAPGVERIKKNLVRTVMRVPLPEGAAPDGAENVIVKRYAVRGPLDWAKYAVKSSRAEAEWDAGRALEAAGVPTAVPLAMAERRQVVLRDAALVQREIRDAIHLNAYVRAHFAGDGEEERRRRALYTELARIIRRMHEAGLIHNDLHGGNVLVNGPPESPQLFIIDLHSLSRRKSASARWFDLAKLLHSLRTCSTPAERLEMCEVYECEGEASALPTKALRGNESARSRFARELESQLEGMERTRVKSRTARSLGRSSLYDITREGGCRIHHQRVLLPAEITRVLAAHRAECDDPDARLLKRSRQSRITRQTARIAGEERSLIVKEYVQGGVFDQLKNLFRDPRPLAAWKAGNGLRVRHFEAAETLALVRCGTGRILSHAYLLMEDLGDGSRLDLVALSQFAGELDAAGRADKHRLIEACADLMSRLHANGVYHSDMKAVNLFVRAGERGPEVVLADYDRVRFGRPVELRRRIKNLAQLSASVAICISLADRLRFYRHYARKDPQLLERWKDVFEGVVAACERKIVVRMEPIE